MSDAGKHGSKSIGPGAISPVQAELNKLKSQVASLTKAFEMLAAQVDEGNHWNKVVRRWLGQGVEVKLSNGDLIVGELLWVDKYTICVRDKDVEDEVIIHKGQLCTIRPR